MVNHWHMWLSHENNKEVLYEEAELSTDGLKGVTEFLEKTLKKYKAELKRRERLRLV